MQNNTLPYNELQQVARNLRLPCGWERRLDARIKRLRPTQKQWLFWYTGLSVILGLIAIHFTQVVWG